MSLNDLQRDFSRYLQAEIEDSRGFEKYCKEVFALKEFGKGSRKRSSKSDNVSKRLKVYYTDYHSRFLRLLELDFSETKKYLGAHEFQTWALKYLAHHPPTSYDASEIGKNFSSFLETYKDQIRSYNPLAASVIAHYESLKLESFLDYDPLKKSSESYQDICKQRMHQLQLEPEEIFQAKVSICASARVFECFFDFKKWQESSQIRMMEKNKTSCHIMFHKDGLCAVIPSTFFEKELFKFCHENLSLEGVLEKVQDLPEFRPESIQNWLGRWLGLGLMELY